jgi:hypothetical protein
MAQPADRHAFAGPTDPAGLLGHAVARLVEHVADSSAAGGTWRCGPLVIVSSDPNAASGAVGAALEASGMPITDDVRVTLNGASFDQEIAAAIAADRLGRLAAALASRRLVVVDRIDLVHGDERQRALVHLLDVSTAVGTTWAVSVPLAPGRGLLPQLASRLGAGLVVTAAAAVNVPTQGPAPSFGRIIRVAARHHDVKPDEVLGPSRSRAVAAARSLAMYLARRLTGRSFQAIGSACGGRDHTTVLHGVRTCGDRIARDAALAADVERLAGMLAGPARSAAPRRSDVDSSLDDRPPRTRRRGRRRTA